MNGRGSQLSCWLPTVVQRACYYSLRCCREGQGIELKRSLIDHQDALLWYDFSWHRKRRVHPSLSHLTHVRIRYRPILHQYFLKMLATTGLGSSDICRYMVSRYMKSFLHYLLGCILMKLFFWNFFGSLRTLCLLKWIPLSGRQRDLCFKMLIKVMNAKPALSLAIAQLILAWPFLFQRKQKTHCRHWRQACLFPLCNPWFKLRGSCHCRRILSRAVSSIDKGHGHKQSRKVDRNMGGNCFCKGFSHSWCKQIALRHFAIAGVFLTCILLFH